MDDNDLDESSKPKVGVHFNKEFQVALVSSDVSANSKKIVDKSQTYLEDIKELSAKSRDIVESAEECAASVEKMRTLVFAARQYLSALTEGRTPTRLQIQASIDECKKQYESKKLELDRLLEQEAAIQKQIDEILQPPAQAS